MHFFLIYYIILFAQSKQHERIKNEGLSPNGKATDSDSVIFQVRILVALLKRYSFEYLFFYAKSQKKHEIAIFLYFVQKRQSLLGKFYI